MNTDLWWHDGAGRGWPATETSRRVEQVEVEVNGRLHTEDRIYRGMLVWSAGEPEALTAGLQPGVTPFLDVPEGLPSEKGTCSHIHWQPGSSAHAESVLWGLEGEELTARAADHAISLPEPEPEEVEA